MITNPPNDFNLLPTDQVFVLMQFDPGMEYRPGWGDGKGVGGGGARHPDRPVPQPGQQQGENS